MGHNGSQNKLIRASYMYTLPALSLTNSCIQLATQYEIYCGMTSNKGEIITLSEFKLFLNRFVVPNLKSFSVRYITGYWQGVEENTAVISIISGNTEIIAQIAAHYKSYFNQDAVLINSWQVSTVLV